MKGAAVECFDPPGGRVFATHRLDEESTIAPWEERSDPPSFGVLEARLKSRGKDHKDEVARRLAEARREMKAAKDYDYLVLNDRLDVAVERVAEIARAARWRNRR